MIKFAVALIPGVSILNIPPAYEGLHRYRATLGHFANHDFKKTVGDWILVTHPRYYYDVLLCNVKWRIASCVLRSIAILARDLMFS